MILKTTFAALLASLAASATAYGQPAAPQADRHSCFLSTQFQGWKAPDAKTIYIRVLPNRYFRLDLEGECTLLRFPDSHLVTVWRGSNYVCRPIDWDLRVSTTPREGPAEPCIVKSMTELTPAEVQAIPPRFKP